MEGYRSVKTVPYYILPHGTSSRALYFTPFVDAIRQAVLGFARKFGVDLKRVAADVSCPTTETSAQTIPSAARHNIRGE